MVAMTKIGALSWIQKRATTVANGNPNSTAVSRRKRLRQTVGRGGSGGRRSSSGSFISLVNTTLHRPMISCLSERAGDCVGIGRGMQLLKNGRVHGMEKKVVIQITLVSHQFSSYVYESNVDPHAGGLVSSKIRLRASSLGPEWLAHRVRRLTSTRVRQPPCASVPFSLLAPHASKDDAGEIKTLTPALSFLRNG